MGLSFDRNQKIILMDQIDEDEVMMEKLCKELVGGGGGERGKGRKA